MTELPSNSPAPFTPGLPPSAESKPKRRRVSSRRRLWLFRLIAAVGIPLFLLLAAEGSLRFLGAGYDAGFLSKLDAKPGYVADNYKFAWRFFSKALARTPQPIVVTKSKPSGVHRIVIFGGSAAMGDPEAAFGMPRILDRMLSKRFPNQEFEIVNAAVTAINSHVVQSIAADCRKLEADAWVIYMGNNEVHGPFGAGTVFTDTETPRWMIRSGLALKKTKIGQLFSSGRKKAAGVPESWGGMKMFLDSQIRHDSPALAKVYVNYRKNLAAVLKMARRSGAKPIVSTVVTNIRDFPPFISLHREGLGEQSLEEWKSHFKQGCQHQQSERFEDAVTSFRAAVAIDDEYAELTFRLGECLDQLGRTDEARACFVQARDLDALRFRADTELNNAIRDVAGNQSGVYFVDAEQEFTRLGGSRITGNDYLYEHVHFNLAGNYELAKLLGDQIISALGLQADPKSPGDWPSIESCADLIGLSPYHRMTVANEVRGRLSVPPFDGQIYQERRMQQLSDQITGYRRGMTAEARRQTVTQYERLIRDYPNDWHLRWQYASLLESAGNLSDAILHQKRVTELLPHYPQGFYSVGKLLNREKKYEEAATYLQSAIALRPAFAEARNSLGIALSHLDQTSEAIDQFRQAIELKPKLAEAHINWGMVLAHGGDQEAAIGQFESAAKADPNHLPAHIRLGKHYVGKEDFEAALPHYQAVSRLRPMDPEAALNLGMLHLKLQNRSEANKQFQRVLRIDPSNRVARQALGQTN